MRYKNAVRRILSCLAIISPAMLATANPAAGTVAITNVTAVNDGSDAIIVEGQVDGSQGFTSLDINGYAPSSFDGETFSLVMPANSNYQINLFGDAGEYASLDYAATNVGLDSAVQVVVGDQLMADLGPAMAKLLSDLDLNEVLGIGPKECVVDTGWLYGCDFYIKALAIEGTPEITLFFTPGSGEALTVNIAVLIPRAVMSTKIKRAFWWGYRKTTVTTDNIFVSFQLGVEATANQSIKLVLDEPSDVQLSIGNMNVSSNTLAAHLVPLFKDVIADVVNAHVAQVAGPFLNLLPIPAIPLDLPVDIDGDGVNDAEFAIRMNAELLDVLASGDGQAVLAGYIQSATVAEGREVLGTRRIGGTLPDAEAVTAPTDINASVSVDLVNQIMTALYQSGIEEKIALPMTVQDLGAFGQALVFFGFNLDDPLLIQLSFNAAPEMLANNSSLYPLGLEMAIPQLSMQMVIPRESGDEVIMDLNADVMVATSLGAEGDGRLKLEFQDLLVLNNVTINGGTLSTMLPPEAMADVIAFALPDILAEFEPTINDLLNVARLELDIGAMLSDWLSAEFPSVPVSAYVTETGVSDDESYLNLGVAIDFP